MAVAPYFHSAYLGATGLTRIPRSIIGPEIRSTMPIEIQVVHEGQGQIWTGHGPLTGSELIAHVEEVIRGKRYAGLRWLLIDLSDSKLDASAAEIRSLGMKEAVVARELPHLVTAVVVPYDYGYGMARMWEMITERAGWSRRVCRRWAEAENFLREEVEVRFGLKLPAELTAR